MAFKDKYKEGEKMQDNVIEITNLSLPYAFQKFNLSLERNKLTAITGPNSCGKTTITNLINRFYEIQQGEILLDGVNIKNINKKSLRQHIGIILQDPFIFARDIKSNIKLNSKCYSSI